MEGITPPGKPSGRRQEKRGDDSDVEAQSELQKLRAEVRRLRAEVRDRDRTIERLQELAHRDLLTNIPNRRGLKEDVKRIFGAMRAASEQREGFRIRAASVVLCDVDYFKVINDTYGHAEGDKVLQTVARILSANVRASDIVGRWGGEEFAIVLLGADEEGAARIAEKLRQCFAETVVRCGNENIRVTVSFGVYEIPKDTRSLDECIKKADLALYRAKETGRNRVVKAGDL
ncbi:MAG: diguanylate cyclase [Candidatus Colwellbacteria bacterium]|nr:diguanylate cyclase [Candidatus Colwellbacteria bacterium]